MAVQAVQVPAVVRQSSARCEHDHYDHLAHALRVPLPYACMQEQRCLFDTRLSTPLCLLFLRRNRAAGVDLTIVENFSATIHKSRDCEHIPGEQSQYPRCRLGLERAR